MAKVEIRSTAAGFSETLGAMRTWFDQHGCQPPDFESSTGPGGGMLLRVEFDSSELAAEFRRDFATLTTPAT